MEGLNRADGGSVGGWGGGGLAELSETFSRLPSGLGGTLVTGWLSAFNHSPSPTRRIRLRGEKEYVKHSVSSC